MPRTWSDSTFIFISTNTEHAPGSIEEHWLDVMGALAELGAHVHFLAVMGSPLAERARALGITVAPYILDRWNVVRSRSRLRKYFRRYQPVLVNSTGVEADLLTRWAARKVEGARVATTLSGVAHQATRRRRPVDILMRGWDTAGMRGVDMIFVPNEETAAVARAAGVAPDRIIIDPLPADEHDHFGRAESIERHVDLYKRFMAERGGGVHGIMDGSTASLRNNGRAR